MPAKKLIVILGNQLFSPDLLARKISNTAECVIFLREEEELCTHFQYHQQKIVFFLSAMRQYAEELRGAGFEVHYEKLGQKKGSYEESLSAFAKKMGAESLHWFEIEDKFFSSEWKLSRRGSNSRSKFGSRPCFSQLMISSAII